MNHTLTPETARILDEFAFLARNIETRITAASPSARDEWEELLLRLPSETELRLGATLLSENQLAVMLSKAKRFFDILGLLQARAERAPPSLAASEEIARASAHVVKS